MTSLSSVQPTNSSPARNRSSFPSSPPSNSPGSQSCNQSLGEATGVGGNNSFNVKPFQLKKLAENVSPSEATSKVRGKSTSKRRSAKKRTSPLKTIDDFFVDRYTLFSLCSPSKTKPFLHGHILTT